jgi:hypothetical protein
MAPYFYYLLMVSGQLFILLLETSAKNTWLNGIGGNI